MLNVSEDQGRIRRKWLPIGGLLLLSLLWAVGWVRADLSPASSSELRLRPLWSEAASLGALAGLAVVGLLVRKERQVDGLSGRAVLVGLGLFVLPSVLVAIAADWIDDATRVAMFSLTPFFAVVLEPHFSSESPSELRGGFPAAMMAVAGTLLVFPVEIPHSYASGLALLAVSISAASVSAANCLGVQICRKRSGWEVSAVAGASAACTLFVVGMIVRHADGADVSVGVWTIPNLFALVLLFWLMPRLTAVQMTTRYVIAPLLANLISLVLLRPHIAVQSWIGLLMIATGAVWMIGAPRGFRDSTSGFLT
jgi:drug/metabolite transporter (DMT)-like permease